MIEVSDLTYHYGLRPVLSDISFTVETGELMVLLGPNGMGKSTLLGCLAGVLWPQYGSVLYDGVPRRQSAEAELAIRQKVVYLPDDVWLPTLKTGREFVLAVGRLYGVDDKRLFDHIDRLMPLLHLDKQQDSNIESYSTGQRKKIALASALITEAPYLLLDEPFSGGLDPAGIAAMKQVLKRLAADENVTIVMTTPVPELVEELAHRVGILRDSGLAHYDTCEALKKAAGTDGPLSKALEKLMYPETADAIAAYFDEDRDAGHPQ